MLKLTPNTPPVLCLALLQDIFLIHELDESDILFVQQSLQMRRRVQIKFPKHGWRYRHIHLAAGEKGMWQTYMYKLVALFSSVH